MSTAPAAAAIYARVSTEDQAERQTVQGQLDFLRKYCDLHQIPVAGEYVDDGISGTVPLHQRPEGRRLLDDAEAKRFGVVLVYRLDRLGRSLKSLLSAHETLDAIHVAIRSATEPFDTASPIGRFVFNLLGSMAELERSTITERMSMGRDRIARDGKYIGGVTPFGYSLDADRRLHPSTQPVPQLGISEADLIGDVFRRVAAGSTLLSEAQRLTALGIRPAKRYGNGAVLHITDTWSLARIASLIHNPIYKGTAVLRSRNGTITAPAPALVDEPTWEAAQAATRRNRSLSKKNAKHSYLLRGLIVCVDCGMGYTGTSTVAGNGQRWHFYRCNGQLSALRPDRTTRCRGKTIGATWLEGLVWDDIKRWAEHPGDYLAEAQHQLRERMAQSVGVEDQRRSVLAEILQKDTERERVLTMYRRGRISMDEADTQLDEIARELATLRAFLESLRAQEALTSAVEAHLSDTAAALLHLQDRVKEIERAGDLMAKRKAIDLLVHQITVHTVGEGRAKQATVTLRYAYQSPQPVVVEPNKRCRT